MYTGTIKSPSHQVRCRISQIYPPACAALSSADKAVIRAVFLRWADEDVHAATTTDNHPEPIGVVDDPALVRDPVRVRGCSGAASVVREFAINRS